MHQAIELWKSCLNHFPDSPGPNREPHYPSRDLLPISSDLWRSNCSPLFLNLRAVILFVCFPSCLPNPDLSWNNLIQEWEMFVILLLFRNWTTATHSGSWKANIMHSFTHILTQELFIHSQPETIRVPNLRSKSPHRHYSLMGDSNKLKQLEYSPYRKHCRRQRIIWAKLSRGVQRDLKVYRNW